MFWIVCEWGWHETHHQDNFFPPISTLVDTKPFVKLIQASHPDITFQTLETNETIETFTIDRVKWVIEEPRSKLRGMFCRTAVLRIDRKDFCLI